MSYGKLISKHPDLKECFFAFSDKQFNEGIEKNNLEGKKIYSGGAGLYGTKEGILNLFKDYENRDKQIAEQCDPQEVYDYEFGNHECEYVCDDEEAIEIVVGLFGAEKAKTVERKYGYCEIKETE